MPEAPVARLENVSYYYPGGERPALLNLNLEVAAGEVLGLVGATGAGKTTLCLALNGIVPQLYGGRFFGRAAVAGLDTVDHPIHELARHVGVVLQDPESQLVTASVENEVAFALENLGVAPEEIRRRVDEALAAVELDGLARKHPHELSGGQQQRLALAAALAQRPRLVVLDEPTAQLDPRATADVFRLVRVLSRERGTAFVVASHAAEELAQAAGRIAVLSRGRLAALGTPEEIFRDEALLRRERIRPPGVTAAFSALRAAGLTTRPPPVRLEEGLAALRELPPGRPFTVPEAPPDAGAAPVLAARDVRFAYPDGTRALDGVDLLVRRGEYVALLGQNGSGKSTLLRHFLHLLEPTSGRVEVEGRDVATRRVTDLARSIGYVAQNPDRQIFNPTVEAEVAFSLLPLRLPAAEQAARVDRALGALGLLAHRGAHPLSLPKGDRARVVIAAVLVMDPAVLIFDEPTIGQDEAGARSILEVTRRLHREGRTVVVVTHHLHLMPDYAQRVVIMAQGRVLADTSLRAAYHAVELLRTAHLEPPQPALLARALHPDNWALTPEELAASFPAGGGAPP
jgi:energy-coupling factor transporter ATP-binding protein EcfA2